MEAASPGGSDSRIVRPKPAPAQKRPWLLVALAAWAVAATGLLAWTLSVPRGPTQAEIWDADGRQLNLMGYYFGFAGQNAAGYLATHNDSLWENATNWIVAAVNVAYMGTFLVPGGFPSAEALNLTWTRLQNCAYAGFVYVHAYDDPSVWSRETYVAYFTQAAGIYANLSLALRGAFAPGVDPLANLGPTKVAFARAQADLLYALNEPMEGISACRGP